MPDPGPFGGLPFFGDLMRMIQQQGSIAWDAARQLAVTIASEGEPEANVDPLERMRLEQLARVAELQVASVTGLTTSVGGRSVEVVPVTRTRWVNATLDAWQPLFSRLADALGTPAGSSEAPGGAGSHGDQGGPADRGPSGSGRPASDHPAGDVPAVPPTDQPVPGDDPDATAGDWLANMMQALSPMLLGMTAGSMVGHLARRSFGQYDLPIPRKASHEVMIVPASIDAFGQEWSIEGDDLRLWVCVHELTHHAVLGVPHIRARLERLLADYAAAFTTDPDSLERHLGDIELGGQAEGMQAFQQLFNDPEVLLGAVQSPEQRALLPQIDAIVAVIVGYVDHVMDRIGTSLVSRYGMVTEAMRRRRVEASDADRFVERLFGLQLTQDRYDRAAAFIDGVVDRGGFDALDRLWQDERFVPTPAEIDAPGLWLARIELPGD